jgi:ubiquinone/menaquinone biosynthesis C-methylase UbiE
MTSFIYELLNYRHQRFVKGGNRFRTKRFDYFVNNFIANEDEYILNIGFGYGLFEKQLEKSRYNNKVIAVDNIFRDIDDYSNVELLIIADACYLPFKDKSIDITFSNSVIEHVGDFDKQSSMVEEIARVSKSFFVQTPNKHFPVEAHHMIPFFQYLPRQMQKAIGIKLLRHYEEVWLLGKKEIDRILNRINSAGINIIKEKFWFFVKSFYIVRHGNS